MWTCLHASCPVGWLALACNYEQHSLSSASLQLTLIGFISLILIVAENKIHSICVPYEGSSYTNWLVRCCCRQAVAASSALCRPWDVSFPEALL